MLIALLTIIVSLYVIFGNFKFLWQDFKKSTKIQYKQSSSKTNN